MVQIDLSNSLTAINRTTFYGCSALQSIMIPDSVTSIDVQAFSNCTSLTELLIPKNVTNIGYSIVGGSDNLISLTVDTENTTYYSEGNCIVRAADKTLIAGCSNSVIPDDIIKIEFAAFFECHNLKTAILPDSLTDLGEVDLQEWTFRDCYSLETVIIPDSMTSIGEYMFFRCISLSEITLPEGITNIEAVAFDYCSALSSVTIPKSVTYIGNGAFGHCTSLSTVYYTGTEEEWNTISIESGNEYLTNAEIIFLGEPEEPEFTFGDIDGDGSVNGKDSYYLACVLAGSLALEEGTAAYFAADIDGDGDINGKDAFSLKCIVSGSLIV